MKIKGKILAGLLFLFSLSLLIAGMAAVYNRKLAHNSEAILKDNYNSVIYSKDMLKALSEMNASPAHAAPAFEHSLLLEQNNITETGEKQMADSLALDFAQLKRDPQDVQLQQVLDRLLFRVMELNMHAIEQKNAAAQETAKQVFEYLLFAGGLFLLVSILFIVRFPSYVARPVIRRDADKTNLMATVSHELKTPAAAIKLSTKLLEDKRVGSLNEEQRQLVQNIREETDRVLKITSEVLNMAQMESGKIQLNMQPAQVKKIIAYAVEAIHLQAEQKPLKLEIVQEENLPDVNADAEKTTWVMINLLSNAIRYAPPQSTIRVSAKLENERVIFSVADQGEGIELQYRDKVFDRYFQVPGSKAGNGLGLAISKEFIEAQHGKIWVESEKGAGSKFSFSLKEHFINDIPL